jgi:hypothetical protein
MRRRRARHIPTGPATGVLVRSYARNLSRRKEVPRAARVKALSLATKAPVQADMPAVAGDDDTKDMSMHVDTKPNAATRIVAAIVALAALMLTGIGAAGTASAAQAQATDPTTVPVTGTLANGTGTVDGTLDVQRFATQNGDLVALGTFTGTVTNASGDVLSSGSQQVAVPVDLAASNGSCQILDLVLAPLDLDLLGLQAHLDQVHLNITAEQGPGNLLGNLLCAVAGLLDGPTNPIGALLDQLVALLNQILGALG